MTKVGKPEVTTITFQADRNNSHRGTLTTNLRTYRVDTVVGQPIANLMNSDPARAKEAIAVYEQAEKTEKYMCFLIIASIALIATGAYCLLKEGRVLTPVGASLALLSGGAFVYTTCVGHDLEKRMEEPWNYRTN